MVVTNEFVVDPLESFSPWLILKDVKDKKYCNLKQGGYNCLYCEPCLSAKKTHVDFFCGGSILLSLVTVTSHLEDTCITRVLLSFKVS